MSIYAQNTITDNLHGGSANGLVGKISDRSEVTLNGQFSYDMPVSIIAGTGGIVPQLTISYNSSNGMGLLGYGFDLEGISMISRAPENLFRDGDADVIRFDQSDRFSLDGMRLSLVKTTSTYREYKTETNNFAKITAEGNVVDPTKFTVYTKDGIIHEYTSAKTLMKASNTKNMYWLETKVSDTKGNYYVITYTGSAANNEYRPTRIDYTGNANASLSPYASVRFTYQSVSRTPAYVSGVKVLRSNVIKDISCYYGEKKIKGYEIAYSTIRGNLFMKQVTEYAGTEKKNPTVFAWNNNGSFNVKCSVSKTDTDFKNTYMVVGDYNGDGLSDILTRVNNNREDLNYKIYISNGKTFNSPVNGKFIIPNVESNKKKINEVKSGDFNGDGYDDVVVERARSSFYAIDLYLTHVDNNGNVSIKYEKTIVTAIHFEHTMMVTDANCDGAADLFVRNKNFSQTSYITLLSQSTESGVEPLAQQYEGDIEDTSWHGNVRFADFDGDGTNEILNIVYDEKDKEHYYKLYPYIMQPSGELKITKNHKGESVGLGLHDRDYFCIGDFNGDGKTDILTMGSSVNVDARWEINFSTGLIGDASTAFNSYVITNLFYPKDKDVFVADINGDGYDDLYVVNKKTSNNVKKPVDIYINNGTGKNFTHYTGAGVYGTDKRKFDFADFNGDGKTDFICYAKLKDSTPGYDVYTVENSDNNLLNSITDGLGYTTKIEYKRLTDKTIHTRGTMTGYPLVSVSCPWSVVSRVSTPNGLGGQHTVDYKYKNLQLHKRGRGVVCFEQVTATDNTMGTVTTSNFEIVKPEIVPCLKSVKTTISGKPIKETVYTNTLRYNFKSGQKEVSFTCLPATVVERAYEYNTGTVTSETTTDTQYDNWGNATKVTVKCGTNTITTENTYSNNESNWLIGRLTKAVVTKSGGSGSLSLASEFAYDGTSGLLVTEKFEPSSPDGYVKTYKYDKFGNILEDVITPNDKNYSPRTTKTEYSSDGRFKVKSINSMGYASTSIIDNNLGVETSSTDINGLVTTYKHNAFGEITETTNPLGTAKTTVAWSSGHPYSPMYTKYYIKQEATGMPTRWEFFDNLGRTLRKVTSGLNGKIIYEDVRYNNKGQVTGTSVPYFKGETAVWNTIEYDAAGRVVKETRAGLGSTSTTYSGLTTTVTDPLNHALVRTYDLNGNLMKSVDAKGGSVTFKYDIDGNCTEVTGPRTTISIEYDKLGNKTKMIDPDMGTIEYKYNSYGELVSQKDSKGETVFKYDDLGRLIIESRPDVEYTHIFDDGWKGALSASICTNGVNQEYTYDKYGRVTTEKEIIKDESFTTSYTYNSQNKVDVTTYPSGLKVKNNYSADGYLLSVADVGSGKSYWKLGSVNARGQILTETLGNSVTVTTQYDTSGAIKQTSAPNLFNKSYAYDKKNNLTGRTDVMRSMTENFEYDELDRLVRIYGNKTKEQKITYDNAGNITSKSNFGSMSYGNKTNRIANSSFSMPVWSEIKYTSFNKIESVKRDKSTNEAVSYYQLELLYGPDKSRKYQQTVYYYKRRTAHDMDFDPLTVLETKYYAGGLYERETVGNNVREINYVSAYGKAVALVEMSSADGERTLYPHYDHLGSVMAYSDDKGKLVEELSYDAWGRRRKADTWAYYSYSDDNITSYDMGFTGHEHIDLFDMVNMDGRMYDPVTGRFLSPDPYVQTPDFTQALNRYAYCLNNPLSLTDPTGYNWIGDTFAAMVGIAVGIETAGLGTGIYGALIGGALGGASAAMVGSVMNGANLWQTAKHTFTGAFWGAAGGIVNFEIGDIENLFARIAVHSVSEGAIEGIRGGHFEHGLLVGFTSSAGGSLINRYGSSLSYAGKVAANAILGGVVSELGGGKFASGAMTAAFTMMYNELLHRGPYYRQLKKILNIYRETGEYTTRYFYEFLGGEIAAAAEANPEWFKNACAARLSRALNEAGFAIPYIEGQTMKGADNKNYFLRAIDMRNYFLKIWGEPRTFSRPTKIKNGIVYQSGLSEVTGHVDVFSDRESGGGAYLYHENLDGKHPNIKTDVWKYGRY